MSNDVKQAWDGLLDIPEGKSGEYEIRHLHKSTGTTLPTSNLRTSFIGGQAGPNLTFSYPTTWHELSYEGGVWMTDLPIEQAQHDEILKPMHGNVLVGGLGLGYTLAVLCNNPRVKNVTVVEISQDVIDLVWEHHHLDPDRFTIIQGDLLEYLKLFREAQTGVICQTWDSAFYDIWQQDGEGTFFEVVVPLRQMSDGLVPDKNIICWNENVMRGQLSMSIQSRYHWLRDSESLKEVHKGMYIPTLEDLAGFRNDKYWDWMVPFWIGLADGKFAMDDVIQYSQAYAEAYGRPGWEKAWAEFIE